MDKVKEKSNKDKILRRLSRKLSALGFTRTRSTFFIRSQGHCIQFVHLHKYTFDSSFCVHIGIRVGGDAREYWTLNGPDSSRYECPDSPNGRKYNFQYHITEETVERCVTNIYDFCVEVAEPWFSTWQESKVLLTSPHSPLDETGKEALTLALAAR